MILRVVVSTTDSGLEKEFSALPLKYPKILAKGALPKAVHAVVIHERHNRKLGIKPHYSHAGKPKQIVARPVCPEFTDIHTPIEAE